MLERWHRYVMSIPMNEKAFSCDLLQLPLIWESEQTQLSILQMNRRPITTDIELLNPMSGCLCIKKNALKERLSYVMVPSAQTQVLCAFI